MKRLLIAGAGGCGREVFQWAEHIQMEKKIWDFVGFLDDNLKALDKYNIGRKVAGTIEDYEPCEDDCLVCAIGDSRTRMEICGYLAGKGAEFTSIIHPTAIVARSCKLGRGVILCPYVIVSTDCHVGDYALINTFSIVGHDSILSNGCTLSPHCKIMGFAHLEEGAFLGGGAIILPSVKVGKYARIGAGSVVLRKVEENTSVFGNPARKIF